MSSNKLARGMVEIPKGVNTGHSENSNFMNVLERTNTLLVQFLSAPEEKRMMLRTELEESYFNATLYNLKDSIKNKIEQDMWNNLFKKHVSDLQGKMKSKDKVEVSKAQSELSLFLDEAMGFYSKFLDVLSLIHNIRLPGKRTSYTKLMSLKDVKHIEDVSEHDLYYIVQHCFVHLGDLSRYHNLSKLARLNYQWAVQLIPNSGHAYNQLAILESASVSQVLSQTNYSHMLRTILYYDFASSCKIPFPAARINLDSLLRHILQESVSELLTSNSFIDAQSCLSSLSVAWLHSYAAMRLRSNIHRCRQLQQRIVEWTVELVKYHDICASHWRDIVTIIALQCALLTSQECPPESPENLSWQTNLHQFTQDLLNALCHGLISVSHDVALLDSLFATPGCVTVLTVFMAWTHHHISSSKSSHTKMNLSAPFGDQVVKLLNIMRPQVTLGSADVPSLPLDLPELQYLSGYEPLRIPSQRFEIFSNGDSIESDSSVTVAPGTVSRKLYLVSMALCLAKHQSSLLVCDGVLFTCVPVAECVPPAVKRVVRNETARRPVNVALASIRSNSAAAETASDGRRKTEGPSPASSGIVTDVRIARCIQDHIALETTGVSGLGASGSAESTRDSLSHGPLAPAPGLIFSSSLPPEYKASSTGPKAVTPATPDATDTITSDTSDHAKTAVASNNPQKVHSYNPNREQFEKDLPPRFANKRCSNNSQKESKTGFKALNYWDSTNSFSNSGDTNLTKKESEMMMLPPTVPSSWLTDEQDRSGRRPLDSNMALAPLHFQMPDVINQQRTTFNNSMQTQGPMAMFPPSSYAQYQSSQPMADHQDYKADIKHFLQTTCSNPSNCTYQTTPSPQDMMDNGHLKYDQMYLPQHNFPPIPPPPQPQTQHQQQQQQQQSSLYPGGHNFDQFSMTRSNNYDKPIFSTSSQSGFSAAGYSTQSIMAQQMAQQQHNHQVRANNPLFNLLPGFINEMQR